MKKTRIAIVASHVIQYQAPFFRRLAREPELDLTVLYCSRAGAVEYLDKDMKTTLRWDLDLLGGYEHRFLRNFGFGRGYTRLINPGLIPALLRGKYDAVIFFLGWGSLSALAGMAACRAAGIPILMFGDSAHPLPETTLARKLRGTALRMLFRMPAAFLTSGVLNAAYYRHYGADERRFFLLPWAVDNDRFAEGARFAPGERDAMRATFGITPEQLAIIFSAKFVPRKDPMTLLKALARMNHRDHAAVVLLGHGELREELGRFAAANHLNVRFPGFVNQTDMAKHYAIGDVFVLSSVYEPRGTVVNEAMASGLPLIVTETYGAIGDIVQEGENAMIFAVGDDATLARQLDELVANPELRERMAKRSREIIATWDYERGVQGVKEALAALR